MSSIISNVLNAAKPGPAPYVIGDYYVPLLILLFLILLIMSVVFATVGTIFQSFGVYTLAKRRGFPKAEWAFIPIVGNYVLGSIYDDINGCCDKKSNQGIWLVFLSAISTIITVIWLVTFLVFVLSGRILVYAQGFVDQFVVPLLILLLLAIVVRMVFTACKYSALTKIFKDYEPENAILFTVLALFFSFLLPYFLFAIRNRQSISITEKYTTN